MPECNCHICTYGRKVDGIIEARDTDKLIELVRELMNGAVDIEEDLAYRKAILDGSWPQSVAILERSLAHAKSMLAASVIFKPAPAPPQSPATTREGT